MRCRQLIEKDKSVTFPTVLEVLFEQVVELVGRLSDFYFFFFFL